MPPGMPGGAMCVQRFDDSLNSAIHITYRISLRSSSMREPRDPLLKVFLFVSSLAPASLAPRAIRRRRLRLVGRLGSLGGLPRGNPPGKQQGGVRGEGVVLCIPPGNERFNPPAGVTGRGGAASRAPGSLASRHVRASSHHGRQGQLRPRGQWSPPCAGRSVVSRAYPTPLPMFLRNRCRCCCPGNDPSAGSPTETLLRLLLPLNDQV